MMDEETSPRNEIFQSEALWPDTSGGGLSEETNALFSKTVTQFLSFFFLFFLAGNTKHHGHKRPLSSAQKVVK